jgi:hypothetical protein
MVIFPNFFKKEGEKKEMEEMHTKRETRKGEQMLHKIYTFTFDIYNATGVQLEMKLSQRRDAGLFLFLFFIPFGL